MSKKSSARCSVTRMDCSVAAILVLFLLETKLMSPAHQTQVVPLAPGLPFASPCTVPSPGSVISSMSEKYSKPIVFSVNREGTLMVFAG